jgi:signal transduction histidine kinase
VAGHGVRTRPPFSCPDGATHVTVRDPVATGSVNRASTAASFGSPAAALGRWVSRWRLRDWRLRTKLTALLMVPLVLAGVLGTLRVTDLAGKAEDLAVLARQVGFARQLDLVVYNLQGERHWLAVLLATGGPADRAALQTKVQVQAQRVDTAAARLRAGDFSAEALGPVAAQAHRAAVSRLAGLAALRQAAPRSTAAPGNATALSAVTVYSDLIAVLLDLDRKALGGAPGPVARQVEGIKALSVAREQASREQAMLLTGILSGSLPATQQATLRSADARFDAAADEFGQAMSPAQRQLYFDAVAVIDRKRLLDAALGRAVRGAPLETAAGDWNSAAAGTVETMRQAVSTLFNELQTDAQARSSQEWHEALRDGAVVAVLLLLAVALLIVVVRSLLHPLRTLRTAAFELADRRLPQSVEQVLATEGVPAQTTVEVDPVPVHSLEEVGQVARALDTVHVRAVRLAAEQAQLRSSLNDVCINLSGRSQRLLDQQRQLIEELRGAVHDPQLRSRLLQLDHLATRMRRHSETLLGLAGGSAHSGAEEPVAVLDVLSTAVSEIDEQHRVIVSPPPAVMVAAPVAGDLVHLIAELLDNATSVTPQGATVTLSGSHIDDDGLLVEVIDSGPGLPVKELQEINARLLSAPETEASSVSSLMGLLVARELAAKHGITVALRHRPDVRGIIATALLPPALVTVERAAGQPPATGWNGTEGQLPLRVSVVDEASAADLFNPASINPASLGVVPAQPSRERTAQEEWLELFGHPEPDPLSAQPLSAQPLSVQLGGDQEQGAAVSDALGSVAAAQQPAEVREEIFEMVSAWFRERQSTPVSTPPSTTASEWWSPFDGPWQVARALRARVDHEFTLAGLPKRQPRAHLVSGADDRVQPTPPPAGPVRTPDAVRGRLTRYQRGLRVGRHARIDPDEPLAWSGMMQRPLDQRPAEENQQ